jgi:hypothetical protein
MYGSCSRCKPRRWSAPYGSWAARSSEALEIDFGLTLVRRSNLLRFTMMMETFDKYNVAFISVAFLTAPWACEDDSAARV